MAVMGNMQIVVGNARSRLANSRRAITAFWRDLALLAVVAMKLHSDL